MSERAYTVKELNALRKLVERKWLYGTYDASVQANSFSRSYQTAEKTTCVEEIVRTHMLAGHTAADLIDSEKPSGELAGHVDA